MVVDLDGMVRQDGCRVGISSIYHQRRGFYYHLNRINEDHTVAYLRCTKYRRGHCQGFGVWRAGTGFRRTHAHNHIPDYLFIDELELRRRILVRCRSGEPTPFKQIFQEERRRYPRAVQVRLTFGRLRCAMSNARRSIYPRIPESLRELGHVLSSPQTEVISMTLDGEDNVYASTVTSNDGYSAVILSSDRQIRFMSRVSHIFGDGTFCTPARIGASQVYNIVTTWRSHIIPLAVVLMERRTTALYIAIFEELRRLNPGFQPEVVMTDYELAQMRAFRVVFPLAELIGCLYHYMAAIIRYAKEMGLLPWIRAYEAVKIIVRLCCVIPLAPRDLMRQAFRIIGNIARTTVYYDILRDFLDYIWTHWLHGPRSVNLCVSNAQDRTNNASESFNHMIQTEIGEAAHPTVWNFLGAVINIEDTAMTDIEVLFNGETPARARRSSSISNDHRVASWTLDLERGDINLHEFLHRIADTVTDVFDTLTGNDRLEQQA